MIKINYKYNVGDYIRFKSKFTNPTCGLVWRAGTIAKITGLAKAYNNKPHYYVNGVEDEVFPESVFAGLATESEFLTQSPEYIEVDTSVGPETKCDTEDSGESDDIAKYRELYLKALKKTYGKVPFETETVEVGSLLEFTEAVLKATKEV
jgi:hypothetical protein